MLTEPRNKMVYLANAVVQEQFAIPEEDAKKVPDLPELFKRWKESAANPDLYGLGLDHLELWKEIPASSDEPYAIVRDYLDVVLKITQNTILWTIVDKPSKEPVATITIDSEWRLWVKVLNAEVLEARTPNMSTGVLWRVDQKVLSGAIMANIEGMPGQSEDRRLFLKLYQLWLEHKRELQQQIDDDWDLPTMRMYKY